MTLAITHAANTTVPVTWTTSIGHTATAQMPTMLHASYAAEQHTTTVVQLADNPTAVQPAVTQTSVGGTIGLGGGALIGLGIVTVFIAKWKTHSKEVRRAFVMGAIATVLVGSWGLFGVFTNTVKSTGDSVGNSVGNTISQQSSVTR